MQRKRSSPWATPSIRVLCLGLQHFPWSSGLRALQNKTLPFGCLHYLKSHTNYYQVCSNFESDEDMLGPPAFSGAHTLALAWNLPFQSWAMQDVEDRSWWRHARAWTSHASLLSNPVQASMLGSRISHACFNSTYVQFEHGRALGPFWGSALGCPMGGSPTLVYVARCKGMSLSCP